MAASERPAPRDVGGELAEDLAAVLDHVSRVCTSASEDRAARRLRELVMRDCRHAATTAAPTETVPARDLYPEYAVWGQTAVVKAGEKVDPVPTVYSGPGWDGTSTVEVGDYRMTLDVAEALAARITAAVRYERAQGAS